MALEDRPKSAGMHEATPPEHKDWRAQNNPKIEDKTLKNPAVQQGFRRTLDRKWHYYLTRPEATLLAFIYTRTIDFGNEEARITYRCIEKGDNSTLGIGMAKTSAYTHLRSLEAKGFISVDNSDRNKGMLIRPNPNWEPTPRMKTVREEKQARRDERLKQMTSTPPAGVRLRQRPINRSSYEPEQLERTFRRAFDKDRDLWAKLNATCPTWTEQQKDFARDVAAGRWGDYSAERCHDLIEWAVRDWADIRGKLNLPLTPDADALLKQAWSLRLEYEWQEAKGVLPDFD